eukprot:scaffold14697_cov487-Ochromonas_danica.AAC.1
MKVTPLHFACSEGYVEIVKVLLSDGRVDVNKKDQFGQTPLKVAKSKQIKRLLIEKGAKRQECIVS